MSNDIDNAAAESKMTRKVAAELSALITPVLFAALVAFGAWTYNRDHNEQKKAMDKIGESVERTEGKLAAALLRNATDEATLVQHADQIGKLTIENASQWQSLSGLDRRVSCVELTGRRCP